MILTVVFPSYHSAEETHIKSAGWISWSYRLLNTHKVLGSSPSLVILFFLSFFSLSFLISISDLLCLTDVSDRGIIFTMYSAPFSFLFFLFPFQLSNVALQ